jgi:hypothetical protein
MQIVLFSVLALAIVTAMGLGIAAAIASAPLPLLERVYDHSRFARLGAKEHAPPGDPAAGIPTVDAAVSTGYAS